MHMSNAYERLAEYKSSSGASQGGCVPRLSWLRAVSYAQVDGVAEESMSSGHALVIRASGRLTLPSLSAAELPDSSRTACLAVGVLMQYIMSLQPEASSASVDTHVQGK